MSGSEYIWDPFQFANCGSKVLETCNGGLFFSVSCSAGHACIITCIAYMKINETIVMLVFLTVSYNTYWPKLSCCTMWKYLWQMEVIGELDLVWFYWFLRIGPLVGGCSTCMLILFSIFGWLRGWIFRLHFV